MNLGVKIEINVSILILIIISSLNFVTVQNPLGILLLSFVQNREF